MSASELGKKLADVETELASEFAVRKRTGKPSNIGKYRALKRLKARILTIQRLRQKKEG